MAKNETTIAIASERELVAIPLTLIGITTVATAATIIAVVNPQNMIDIFSPLRPYNGRHVCFLQRLCAVLYIHDFGLDLVPQSHKKVFKYQCIVSVLRQNDVE